MEHNSNRYGNWLKGTSWAEATWNNGNIKLVTLADFV